jgi:hypothetical protein
LADDVQAASELVQAAQQMSQVGRTSDFYPASREIKQERRST